MLTTKTDNASYYETAYDGFEENQLGYRAYGHLNFLGSTAGVMLEQRVAHTGHQSLTITGAQSLSMTTKANGYFFRPNIPAGGTQRYTVTAWFNVADNTPPKITVSGSPVSNVLTQSDGVRIEGWQKVETSFTANAAEGITISFSAPGAQGNVYVDDIRIQPFKSSMRNFV